LPYEILSCPGTPVALFRMWDRFSADDGLAAYVDYVSRADYDPSRTMLTDAGAVTGIPANYRQVAVRVARLAPVLATIPDGTRSVILAPRDHQFGMARMLAQVAGHVTPLDIHVTRDEVEALVLAGCPDRDIAALATRLRQG